jgi:hypothetical protein
VLEERRSNFLFRKISRKIDAEDFGAERTGESADFYCSTLMFWLLMMEP